MGDAPLPGLTIRTFRAGEEPDRLAGWFEAQARGFHQGRTTEEMRTHYARHLDADDAVLRGAWEDAPALGSGTVPVATYASFDKTLNTGLDLLPVRMVSDVTVSPTHRRRGLLRALMTEDLADAAAQGVPLAALTATEGSIYGRFGFGPAAFHQSVTVDTGPRFALREPHDAERDSGQVVLLEPDEAWPTTAAVFTRFHEETRGSVARPQFYEPIMRATFDFDAGPDRKLRTAVHLDEHGEPDGYVAYRAGDRKDFHRAIAVSDLVALTPTAHGRLWRFLADIDLSDSVEWRQAPVDDPLPWLLADPFLVRVTRVVDALWVRVLDVPRALEARPWGRDGALVLEVDDPLGHAAGRYRVAVEGGRARVERTDAAGDVRLHAETLGAAYLGGVRTDTLRRSGRLAGTDEAVAQWAALADAGPTPYCLTHF